MTGQTPTQLLQPPPSATWSNLCPGVGAAAAIPAGLTGLDVTNGGKLHTTNASGTIEDAKVTNVEVRWV